MPSPRPYQKVVLDTSPLIAALAFEFIAQEPGAEYLKRGLNPYLNDPLHVYNFHALLGSVEEFLITSHVIGEIRSETHVNSEHHAAYWQCSMDFLEKRHFSEGVVTVAELNQDEDLRRIVCAVGPTDAGLVALASNEGCVLLTDDSRLFSWLGIFPDVKIELIETLVRDKTLGSDKPLKAEKKPRR